MPDAKMEKTPQIPGADDAGFESEDLELDALEQVAGGSILPQTNCGCIDP
ncbi:MAG TPA: hypothetical protein VFR37_11165 [Longimicrobium sp.]|nr:hypothetical protein [Longimicrobium sp.]